MKIRCENCHSDFYFDPPAVGDPPALARCTHCEFPNAVPGSTTAEHAPTYAQCFNCGKQMIHNPLQAIPICPDCLEGEEKVTAAVKEWMVKKMTGQIYGPFDMDTIHVWIESAKIVPRDEVAKVGGQWKRFDTHAIFARYFSPEALAASAAEGARELPGVAPVVNAVRAIKESGIRQTVEVGALKKRMDVDWSWWGSNLVGLIGIVAAAAGTWFLIDQQWLVFPESWIESSKSAVVENVVDPVKNHGKAESIGADELRKLLDRLKGENAEVKEPASTLFARGRTLFLRDTAPALRDAKKLLERAVVANPGDDLALAALAEVYSSTVDAKLQQDAVRLLEEAERLNGSSAEVHRARSAFQIATLHLDEARTEAQAALKLNPNDAEAEYYIGLTYLRTTEDKSRDALAHLQRAVELDPSLHKAHHKMGLVYLNLKDYKKAYTAFQKKLSLDPQNVRGLADLGHLYEEVGDLNRAIELYEQARKVDPEEDPKVTLDLAVLLYQARGQLARARSLLTEITPDGDSYKLSLPDHKEALVHLAAVQRLGGETNRALETLDRVLRIDASFGPALFQQALANLVLGKLDEAGRALRTVSGDGRPDVQSAIRFYLGRLLTAQKKMKDAIDEYEGSVEVFKPNLKARLALVNAQLDLQQLDDALGSASEGSKEDPLYMGRRAVRTLYYHQYPDLSSAVPNFARVAQEKFYVADTHAFLGMLYLQIGQRAAAIQTFQRALETSADNVPALLNLGLMAYAQGDPRTALTLLTRLTDVHSQEGLAYVYQGMALTDMGRYSDAEAIFQKAIRYQRKNPTLHDAMGMLSVKLGKADRAREEFLQSIALDPEYVPPRQHLFQYVP